MKRLISVFMVCVLMLTTMAACSKTKDSPKDVTIRTDSFETVSNAPENVASAPEQQAIPERKAGAVDPNTGLYMNPFTGVFDIEASAYGKRPYGIMINNIKEALPQWGISSPDVCYEFLVEGGITRILALFADGADIPKLGPVRSARTYYVSTVKSYDAIYVHFGASDSGNSLIKKLSINDIDGMTSSSAFKRDPERSKIRDIEHTYYTDSEKIIAATAKKKYRTDSNIENFAAFNFTNEGENITVNGAVSDATDIKVVFSKYSNSEFKYNADEKVYYKDEFGKPHVDANNDKQITLKNVIVISDTHTNEVKNTKCLILAQKSGSGYYFSEGKAVKIKWTKGDYSNQYTYTTADGAPLKINPGKTWVSVIRNDSKSSVNF